MMTHKSKYVFKFWHYGAAITLLLSSVLGYNLWHGDKSLFISGPPTHGHHQIEMSCNSCHGTSFADREVMQTACESCHLNTLNKFSDTHPKSKFTDPRNAELLSHLDATQCVTCHREHKPEITRKYGVTLAKDFCAHCHQNIAQDRPSHSDFGFDTCASSGCHNYHDNTALYENFFRKHTKDLWLAQKPVIPSTTGMSTWLKKNKSVLALTGAEQDSPVASSDLKISAQWSHSQHAKADVNCSDCHGKEDKWQTTGPAVQLESCTQCHAKQASGFTQGKHGMRLAQEVLGRLSPMSPTLSWLPMQTQAHTKTLTCSSCHSPHQPDLGYASVNACLDCHNDTHSNNFKSSKHGQLWQQAQLGEIASERGVSCASCHMPRLKVGRNVYVEHNQSATLKPNSKMIRTVCLHCHGVEFSLAALADKTLIENNFSSKPDNHHLSFDLVKERINKKDETNAP